MAAGLGTWEARRETRKEGGTRYVMVVVVEPYRSARPPLDDAPRLGFIDVECLGVRLRHILLCLSRLGSVDINSHGDRSRDVLPRPTAGVEGGQ